MDKTDITQVLNYIEENTRVSDQTTIEYLDLKNHMGRLVLKQNHVIFGRRGSGKSLLLKSLKEKNPNIACIKINLEDFKDISFPNSIIQVLIGVIEQLSNTLSGQYKWYNFEYWKNGRGLIRDLKNQITLLNSRLLSPDQYDEVITNKTGEKYSGSGIVNSGGASFGAAGEVSAEVEITKDFRIDKLDILKNELPKIKNLINSISAQLDKDIFLILDDFYFIRKGDQPYFIDFFHRMAKNTSLYLKVATIKHRSHLYVQSDTCIGIEIGHDAHDVNLDYSLENFEALVNFMKDLLKHVNLKVGVDIDYDDLITVNAFRFLCLASGGVPRDFFSLFISLGDLLGESKSITKPNVIERSIANKPNKLEAFKTDSAEEKYILEHYLQYIEAFVITEKKWNSFLVSNSEVQRFPQINQAIKELVDLRLLHIANSNMSAAHSDGTRYSAYMVDIGLFPNANPRGFTQVEPGQKDEQHREDKIRSAPKINLINFQQEIESLNLAKSLKVTE